MSNLVSHHAGEIAQLCRLHGVKRLELFGSAARGDDNSDSDMDFFVEFLSDDWHGDRWFGLQEGLEALLGRKVELVSITAATNPHFLEVANRHKVPLYAA